jgi:hypothetical protein
MRANWANQQDDPFIREYLAASADERQAIVEYYFNKRRK